MALFRYTAKRSLVPGHVLNDEYEINIPLVVNDRGRERHYVESVAINGTTETTYLRGDRAFDVVTKPLEPVRYAQVIEFLDSVEAGESFSFQPLSPGPVYQCIRVDQGYKDQRAVRQGNGGGSDYMNTSFRVRVIA